jgi:hypothetical protein
MAQGRHTNDGVYRLLFRRHLHQAQGISASVLWDIKKAFDNFRSAAYKFGYPVGWLRLSLSSYAWDRTLVVEHAAGHTVKAQVGIVAGAMNATYELHLSLLGMIHAHSQASRQ